MSEQISCEETKRAYLAEREQLCKWHFEAARELDKLIFAVASGNLGLSVVLAREFRQGGLPVLPGVLIACWFFSVLAIAASMLSIWQSSRGHLRYLRIMDDVGDATGFSDSYWCEVLRQQDESGFEKRIVCLNWAAMAGLLLGVTLHLIYCTAATLSSTEVPS